MERGGEDLVKPARNNGRARQVLRTILYLRTDRKKKEKKKKAQNKQKRKRKKDPKKADLGGFQHVFWRHRTLLCVPRMQVSLYLPWEPFSKDIPCNLWPKYPLFFPYYHIYSGAFQLVPSIVRSLVNIFGTPWQLQEDRPALVHYNCPVNPLWIPLDSDLRQPVWPRCRLPIPPLHYIDPWMSVRLGYFRYLILQL